MRRKTAKKGARKTGSVLLVKVTSEAWLRSFIDKSLVREAEVRLSCGKPLDNPL